LYYILKITDKNNLMKLHKSTRVLLLLTLISISILSFTNCEKNTLDSGNNGTIPELTTIQASNISHQSAVSGGEIISTGSAEISAKGVCWDVNENPTISDGKTIDGTGTDPYTSVLSNLSAGMEYFVRAYATNGAGTAYGNQFSFVTSPPPSSSFSVLIDGLPYTPNTISVNTVSGKIGISAMSGDENFLIFLPEDFTTGTHSFSMFGDYIGQYIPSISTVYASTTGEITITEHNLSTGKIVATFYFTGTTPDFLNTIEATEGAFTVYH
jgi:hypothetical protein